MHFTLHLTDECNMACRYCYVRQGPRTMTLATARMAVDLAAQSARHCGIIFFGGEPLLQRNLICDTVAYGESLQEKGQVRFYYKITTNGMLLDDAFLRYSTEHQVLVALSHDGVKAAHDANRVRKDGGGTYDQLEAAAEKLLSYRPYAPVMMTVSPNTVQHYTAGVKHLYALGFRYLICSMDYAGAWEEGSLAELRRQYRKLAAFYREKTLREEKFYLSPFEVKMSSHIRGDDYCSERCELGKKQISVAPDGKLYPCVQFIDDAEYCIGDVQNGIRHDKRLQWYERNEEEKESCRDCVIRNRCNHHCACLNKQSTGDLRKVSPALCAHERILLPIADALAENLYRKRSALFIQKQYNDMFPLLSLAEDRLSYNDR